MTRKKYPPGESIEQLHRICDAWRRHTPDAKYGNKTLAEMQAGITGIDQKQNRLDDLDSRANAMRIERDGDIADWMEFSKFIRFGVAADPAFGEDSAFYEDLGLMRVSERNTGKGRSKKSPDEGGESS